MNPDPMDAIVRLRDMVHAGAGLAILYLLGYSYKRWRRPLQDFLFRREDPEEEGDLFCREGPRTAEEVAADEEFARRTEDDAPAAMDSDLFSAID